MTTTIARGRRLVVPAEGLRVARAGITFHNVGPDRVRIGIEVRNHGPTPSLPARMKIDAAPFGAFLPWRPLTTLMIPPLPPGGSTRVATTVTQDRPGPVPGAAGTIPRRLLTATGADDGNLRRTGGVATRVLLAAMSGGFTGRRSSWSSRPLPSDLLELLDGPRPHWAGNLNVWICSRPVERHMAPRLRVHAGRANLAMFCVGGSDEYAFHVEDQGADWGWSIFDASRGRPVEIQAYRGADGPWSSFRTMGMLFLVLRPPADCPPGRIDIGVTQRSSGRTAHVEFDLDPTAEGPGCFRL